MRNLIRFLTCVRNDIRINIREAMQNMLRRRTQKIASIHTICGQQTGVFQTPALLDLHFFLVPLVPMLEQHQLGAD